MKSKPSERLSNSEIAELLAAEAETAKYPVQRAMRKAGRAAFLWPFEGTDLWRQKGALTELAGIGPFLEKIISNWIEKPPARRSPPEIRANFLTWIEAQ